jgi:Antirestriction protein (ArdA).
MLKADLKVSVFLRQPHNPSCGFEVELPTSKEDLERKISHFYNKCGEEYILSSVEKEGYAYILRINEYDDVVELNNLLLKLTEMSEDDMKLYLTAYSYFNQNEEITEKYLNNKMYEYFTNVDSKVALGEKVMEVGYLGFIQEKLKQYMDTEKIGNEWICKGARISNILNTSFRQLSEGEYAMSVKKGFIK